MAAVEVDPPAPGLTCELLPTVLRCPERCAITTCSQQPPPGWRVTSDRFRHWVSKLKDVLGPLGCHRTSIPRWSVLSEQVPLAGIAHNCGTVRFGTDPRRSALDVNCKVHDLDNLYVVVASFFPSSSAVNPRLTTIASALPVDDHLLDRLGALPAASGETMGDLCGEHPDAPATRDRAAGRRAMTSRKVGVLGPGAIGGLIAAR